MSVTPKANNRSTGNVIATSTSDWPLRALLFIAIPRSPTASWSTYPS